jgi:glycosyltransferase involved in cell wall biosynthesis
MKLFSLSGDNSCARGIEGPHHQMLEEFHLHWERIDILVPFHPEARDLKLFDNVYFHVGPKSFSARHPWIVNKGKQLIDEHQHDLINAHDYPPFVNGRAARALTRQTGLPHVLEIFHIEGYPKPTGLKDRLGQLLSRCVLKKVWPEAAAIRVINKTQVPNWLKEQGVPEEKLRLLTASYIDLETFKPQELRKVHDLIHVGRLVPNKGLMDLLTVIKRNPKLTLCLVGVGPEEARLKGFVRKNNLQSQVTFGGWVETNLELSEWLNRARIYVCCSRSEGGPRGTLEAMACGLPVISTGVGHMIDLIQHRHNGLLVDFTVDSLEHEINWLLSRPEEARLIAERGRALTKDFEKKKLIKELATGFQNLVKKK